MHPIDSSEFFQLVRDKYRFANFYRDNGTVEHLATALGSGEASNSSKFEFSTLYISNSYFSLSIRGASEYTDGIWAKVTMTNSHVNIKWSLDREPPNVTSVWDALFPLNAIAFDVAQIVPHLLLPACPFSYFPVVLESKNSVEEGVKLAKLRVRREDTEVVMFIEEQSLTLIRTTSERRTLEHPGCISVSTSYDPSFQPFSLPD